MATQRSTRARRPPKPHDAGSPRESTATAPPENDDDPKAETRALDEAWRIIIDRRDDDSIDDRPFLSLLFAAVAGGPYEGAEGPVLLDFNIYGDQPDANQQWHKRAAWLGFLRTHGEAMAQIAVELSTGDLRERVQIIADRLRSLLKQGQSTMAARESKRLDLAAPLPTVDPWPPVFAGEPVSRAHGHLLAYPLNWHAPHELANWARAFAYYATGLRALSPQAVERLAFERLRRLLLMATEGLDVGFVDEDGRPIRVSSARLAEQFRKHLQIAGVDRAELFERSEARRPIRLHDTRATFITIALANGKTET